MTRALLQQALDVLEHDVMQATYAGGVKIANVAIAIRAELAKPAQQERKPALICNTCGADRFIEDCKGVRSMCPLFGTAQTIKETP